MLNNVRARILKWSEVSWKSRTLLKKWLQLAAPWNKQLDVEAFNHPSLEIAEATVNGQAVAFCPMEKCFVVKAYALAPGLDRDLAQSAGDAMDAEIARMAQRNGIEKLFLIVPKNHPCLGDFEEDEWSEVRVYERKIPLSVRSGGIPLHNQTAATTFLN